MKIAAAAVAAVMALAAPATAAETINLSCKASVPCKVRCGTGGAILFELEQVFKVEINPLTANGSFLVGVTGNKGNGTVLVTNGMSCAFEGLLK